MASANIHDYIAPGRRAHLVGIGGVSMSPLAEVLHKAGMVITGSDMRNSATVEHLRALGIPVAIGHRWENVQGAELVIRTAAVHDENPEIAAARATGIPVFERAQAWGAIMKGYKNALCIAGTHGKTTTTSMCTPLIMAARMDPTVMIGGTLPLLGSGYRVGHGDTIILESCEYCNSFLSFFPTVAVILNIEADHLDFFKDLDDVEHSFRAFADRVPESGVIVANADDANTMHTLEGEERPVLTFGLEQGDVRAANLAWTRGLPSFDGVYRGDVFTHVALRVPGEHNVKNALAAAAAAIALAVEPEVILMDEPTSALDPISTSKIEDLAMELKDKYTIVIVTHNMQQAARISDKTAFFLLGEVVEYNNTSDLFANPRDERTESYITGRFG